jgi:uncharacterized protein (DUF1697 family)
MPCMNFAAFFRNLNLGRPHCPTRQQFEAAFIEAGASTAASFLTNGTIAFQASHSRDARKILTLACKSMAATCGLKEPAFLRELSYLAKLVADHPFASLDRSVVYGCCVTLLHDDAVILGCIARASPRGDVEIIQLIGSEALCIARKLTKSPGSPNAFLEKALDLPATTRAWNTVVRLVAKHGQPFKVRGGAEMGGDYTRSFSNHPQLKQQWNF